MSRAKGLFAVALAAGLATTAFAGGPLYTYDYVNKIPYAWNMASWPNGQVPVYTDLGTLGVLSNQRANEMVVFATGQWSNVPTSSFRDAVAGDFSALGLSDIDNSNVTSVVGTWNGGGIDVVYDSDGSILTNFFGVPPTAVLGITNIDYVANTGPEILEAWMVLSGPGIHGNDPNGIGFQGTVTHEMGHALNLAHSQMNGAVGNQSVLDEPAPPGCNAPYTGYPTVDTVETMYPISTPEPGQTGEYQGTIDRIDDQAALSDIYPAAGYPGNRGTIKGQIYDADGNLVTGVNVIARNGADPFYDCNSYISGQLSKGQAGPDGSFVLSDLTPGGRYVIYVDNLEVGAFSVPRPLVLPGPEEYYNGANESTDAAVDDRCSWTTIPAAAGSPVTADIHFQRYTGAPSLMISPNVMTVTDITPDGNIVVGAYQQYDTVLRWNLVTGDFEELGGEMRGMTSISDDGTKIAANYIDTDGVSYPSIYTDNDGWTPLPPVTGGIPCTDGYGTSTGAAMDISGDGNTVVGLSYGNTGCGGGTTRGFKWTSATGTVALAKLNNFAAPGKANAVNYDGSVIVGWDQASTGFRRGVMWKNGVLKQILYNPGAQWTGEAIDVSRDGLWAIGTSSSFTSGKAYRYNTSTFATELFANTGANTSATAAGINDADSLIVGWQNNGNAFTASFWTPQTGWSDLNAFLDAQGVNTEGVLILGPNVVSADGTTMAGAAASRYGTLGFALKTPTTVMCHVPAGGPPQAISVAFPQGYTTALAAGDTLGPCACNAAPPTGIPAVGFAARVAGVTPLTWTSVAGATGYDLARGDLPILRSTQGDWSTATTDCLESQLHANTYDESDAPAPGDGFWYLVRAANCGGHGSFDSGAPSQISSRDAGMQASGATCP